MHTFRPSRGRVLFEVFCALGIAASFAGGWIQTGASAFLPAAAIAALYGLVHAFGLAGRGQAVVVAEPALELKADDRLPAQLEPVDPIESAGLFEPEAPSAGKGRKPRAPRKPRARRKAAEDKKVMEPAPPQEEEVGFVGPPEEEGVALAEFSEEEVAHIPLVPLFEPEPFVRQQRVFGRKAG